MPAGTSPQVTEYGLEVAVPMRVALPPAGVSKNSTLLIVAVGSLALAVIVMLDPGVNEAPEAGLVICTDGACAAPLHAKPLTVKAAGTLLVPPTVPVNPIVVLAPVARAPFQLSLATVTFWPFCVYVPSQPLLITWLLPNVNPSVQLVMAAALLVIVMPAWKPPGQLLVTEYVTVQGDVAAAAGPAAAVAAAPAANSTSDAAQQVMRRS